VRIRNFRELGYGIWQSWFSNFRPKSSIQNWYRVETANNGTIPPTFGYATRLVLAKEGFLMLVLSRKRDESVVVGDEVTVTVEEISDEGGQRIIGAKVRLGFQSPRYVAIFRSECRDRISSGFQSSGFSRRPRQQTGKLVEIADARVRLKIQVPHRIPIRCNGQPVVEFEPMDAGGGRPAAASVVHHIVCHKEDRITICNNITVATLDVQQFIPLDRLEPAGSK
jgi:carbon storage regulator CsrA